MDAKKIDLEKGWLEVLGSEFEKDYMKKLKGFLQTELKKGKTIYPKGNQYFEAFNQTPFHKVKVVLLGQDPYHGPGQAHGLCFSVNKDVPPPPSLVNIYKELMEDLNVSPAKNGFLLPWAKEGVLLLNSTLTVEKNKAGSHQNKGWEEFTDAALKALNDKKENLVFILWGSFAQKKGRFINTKKHLVIKSVHPSPLSAYRGFFGSKPFSKANTYLVKNGKTPIQWQL